MYIPSFRSATDALWYSNRFHLKSWLMQSSSLQAFTQGSSILVSDVEFFDSGISWFLESSQSHADESTHTSRQLRVSELNLFHATTASGWQVADVTTQLLVSPVTQSKAPELGSISDYGNLVTRSELDKPDGEGVHRSWCTITAEQATGAGVRQVAVDVATGVVAHVDADNKTDDQQAYCKLGCLARIVSLPWALTRATVHGSLPGCGWLNESESSHSIAADVTRRSLVFRVFEDGYYLNVWLESEFLSSSAWVSKRRYALQVRTSLTFTLSHAVEAEGPLSHYVLVASHLLSNVMLMFADSLTRLISLDRIFTERNTAAQPYGFWWNSTTRFWYEQNNTSISRHIVPMILRHPNIERWPACCKYAPLNNFPRLVLRHRSLYDELAKDIAPKDPYWQQEDAWNRDLSESGKTVYARHTRIGNSSKAVSGSILLLSQHWYRASSTNSGSINIDQFHEESSEQKVGEEIAGELRAVMLRSMKAINFHQINPDLDPWTSYMYAEEFHLNLQTC
ncbi:uncharacterized protein MYCFIDRAFT_169837 [Pseudocercospora fijiensis CIRAD86]|uniref:Uncharacterized protein n=1 Tax=Pseudocercospora fijiensis (strain CIRAD86) TaxID=383855 RepID=N1QAY2_PSEFD|nr:uncharacterized protein MYCFIDRAFT_169837 [Pseudocercospora fijiensis CIRAD86]EME88163.1 hypothetical protein MYCFIDRAFT_169837 [Pseudocercospora fijiensis CIRAD86]